MLRIKKPFAHAAGALLFVPLLAGCSGTPVPNTQLTEAKVSTSSAEAVGARTEPSAALHLKLAEDGIRDAELLIKEGKNEEALARLEYATADAELARSMAEAAVAKTQSEEAAAKLEKLRTAVSAAGGKS